jgi:hypothetical protein
MAEVNSFPPGNQSFRQVRRLLKMDMPNNGISFNCIPRPKTWHGCVEQHHAAAGFRIPAGESIGHHSTNIVPDDVNVFQVEVFHQLMNVFRHICSVITACRCRRTAYAAQINCTTVNCFANSGMTR